MLEANPNLSTRDIKYILAGTAKNTDPTFAGVASTAIIAGSNIVLEQGWVTNAAGWTFSNRYGFGAIDASAAVAMARAYTSYLPAQQGVSFEMLVAAPAVIPAGSATGLSYDIPVSAPFPSVESVVVFLTLIRRRFWGATRLSFSPLPGAPKSILIHAYKGLQNTSIARSRIASNAFYGESVNGNWRLTFMDFCPPASVSTRLSTTVPQELAIVGH